MNERRGTMALRVAVTEWKKWVRNPRMMIVGMLIIVVKNIAVGPLLEKAVRMNSKVNVFEPLVAVGNSDISMLLLPAVFIVLVSDYPVMEANSLFFASRTGRKKWYIGQIIFAALTVVSFLAAFFVLVTIISLKDADYSLRWSEGTRLFASRFPDAIGSFAHRLLPSNLYNQLSLGRAIIFTFTLLALYLFMLEMVLLVFTVYGKRKFGIIAVYVIIFAGLAACSKNGGMKWAFPMPNSIIWMHFTEILRKPVKAISYSYMYFVVLSSALIAAGFFGLKNMDFEYVEGE